MALFSNNFNCSCCSEGEQKGGEQLKAPAYIILLLSDFSIWFSGIDMFGLLLLGSI